MAITQADADLVVSVVVNALVGAVVLLGFELARHRYPFLYNSRRAHERVRPAPPPPAEDGFGPTAAADDATSAAWRREAVPGLVGYPTGAPHAEPRAPINLADAAAAVAAAETRGFLAWVRPALRPTHAWFEAHRGRDAALYLRFLSAMTLLCAALLVLVFAAVVPTNAAGTNRYLPPDDPRYVAGLRVISMANLQEDTALVWVPAIMTLVITLLVCHALYRLQLGYARATATLHARSTRAARRTVMAVASPLARKADVRAVVARLLEPHGRDAVTACHVVAPDRRLVALWKREARAVQALRRAAYGATPALHSDAADLEAALAPLALIAREQHLRDLLDGAKDRLHRRRRPAPNPAHALAAARLEVHEARQALCVRQARQLTAARDWLGGTGSAASLVTVLDLTAPATGDDDEDYETDDNASTATADEVASSAASADGSGRSQPATASATHSQRRLSAAPPQRIVFLTFRDAATADACRRDAARWLRFWWMTPAPHRQDLNWRWLHLPPGRKTINRALALAVVVGVTLFWTIPVTFVQGLSNLEGLGELPAFNWLAPLLNAWPGATALVSAYVAPLLLLILVAIVPPVLRAQALREGRFTWTSTERAVLTRYAGFLLVNVFLVSTLAGTAFNRLGEIVSGDVDVGTMLAEALPGQGEFFTTYVITKTGLAGLALLEPAALVRFLVKAVGRPAVIADVAVQRRPAANYAVFWALDLLVFTITLAYALLYPPILLFGTVYFGLQCILRRYQMLYMAVPRHELHGRLWPRVRDLCLIGVVLFQWTMVGWFSLRRSPAVVLPAVSTGMVIVFAVLARRLHDHGHADVRPLMDQLRQWVRRRRAPAYSADADTDADVSDEAEMERLRTAAPNDRDPEAVRRLLHGGADDDDYDGLTDGGRIPAAIAERLYYCQPTMIPPAPGLVDDPFNPFRLQFPWHDL